MSISNPVQNFGNTIKSFQGKVKSSDETTLLKRAKEVYEMVKDLPLDDITEKMVQLATSDLLGRLKHLK